jgi:hypothetical protein
VRARALFVLFEPMGVGVKLLSPSGATAPGAGPFLLSTRGEGPPGGLRHPLGAVELNEGDRTGLEAEHLL